MSSRLGAIQPRKCKFNSQKYVKHEGEQYSYSIPFQEASNVLVTPLALRVSRGGGDQVLSPRCGWESLMKNVTLGNVTMSHRTREARRMPCVSLPLNYDRSAARAALEN
ncbi:hypothetical protein EVAR_67978_1 [Eumeta japonica]|uniref:Uncharacterized protein n=1 Tax=Eumeta variegata TaxID=151549 RepID=A0A4C1S919_EUMVA|nr:hypothetical protein EVAR_67978_1 [Eumeta japonica]